MHILITGARGFLGERIMDALPGASASISLRGKDEKFILSYIEKESPDVICHTAAISDTGVCQREPEESYKANVLLPVYLARAAKSTNAKLLCLSSDQVYNGSVSDFAYTEDAPLSPVNVYGHHKLEMENRVLDCLPSAVLLRATWMYDMPAYGGVCRGNFLVNTLKAALSNQPITASSHQYRGLTYAREAATNVCKAFSLPGGVYNFGSEADGSMYDATRFLLSCLHASPSLVSDAPPRPNLWMNTQKLKNAGISFSTVCDGLLHCLRDYQLIENNP